MNFFFFGTKYNKLEQLDQQDRGLEGLVILGMNGWMPSYGVRVGKIKEKH